MKWLWELSVEMYIVNKDLEESFRITILHIRVYSITMPFSFFPSIM